MHIGGGGASRKDVFEATNALGMALERTINRAGLVGLIVSSLITISGVIVEFVVMADFGYVLIAVGILGLSVGSTLRFA